MLERKNQTLSLVLLFICFSNLFSQEKSIYNNSYLDPFVVNPACTGLEYYPVAHVSIEKQWLGFPGSPTTYKITGNSKLGRYGFYDPKGFVNKGPLKLKERVGIGAALYNDVNGPLSNFGGILSYGYHIPLQLKSSLSFGMSILMSNYSLNSSILDPDQSNDNYLLTGNNDVFRANFGAGVLYRTNEYFAGISINKILPGTSKIDENEKTQPSYFLIAGYKFGKSENLFNYEPSLEVRYISSEEILYDLHAKVYFKRLYWAAVSYSSTMKMNMQFALNIYKMLYLGYNYGFTFNKIESFNKGSHQISIGINLGLTNIDGIRKTI